MEKHPDELLSAYLDHELTYDEQLAVEDHLSTCIHCQTLLEELSSIKNNYLARIRHWRSQMISRKSSC
ncbi:anti-sigma factor family protein [Tepidibacillus decaturensis]|uniref:Anti-sigma-W factor RsiW n=1 Tax=Tepidibacillus decaturensis TaxID=1413211 RepID=A0A135L0V7_9BACI|nr:zf-HC2 domain-containing protein [Tepidibacillus decaturensis]KXG42543.1 hypothetical protein U473_13770 [Tepidibacillus decaturensis]